MTASNESIDEALEEAAVEPQGLRTYLIPFLDRFGILIVILVTPVNVRRPESPRPLEERTDIRGLEHLRRRRRS